MGDREYGQGNLEIYAGGCALNSGYKKMYYMDTAKGLNSGDDIVNIMFEDLFDYIYENKKIKEWIHYICSESW